MGSLLDGLLARAFESFDQDLGRQGAYPRQAEVKYRLGRSYLKRGRWADAHSAFRLSEPLLAEERGPTHRLTIAAILGQAECEVRMRQPGSACTDYRRALERMVEGGHAGHPAAAAISTWLAEWCDDIGAG